MKYGLVHSGGGRKGAFGVGVISELVKPRIGRDWEVLRGTSVGAINCAKLALEGDIRDNAEELEEMWLQLDTRQVWKPWFWGALAGLWRESFFDSRPLWELLERELDYPIQRDIAVGCVEYATGKYFEARPTSKLNGVQPWWKYVAASSSYPAALLPVKLPEGLCGDGGAVSATPLKGAIDAGCDVIDVVLMGPMDAKLIDVSDNRLGTKLNAVDIALRTVDLLAHAALVRDVQQALAVNERVKNGTDKHHRLITLNVFCPEHHLTKSPFDALDFDPKRTRELIRMGKEVAKARMRS